MLFSELQLTGRFDSREEKVTQGTFNVSRLETEARVNVCVIHLYHTNFIVFDIRLKEVITDFKKEPWTLVKISLYSPEKYLDSTHIL